MLKLLKQYEFVVFAVYVALCWRSWKGVTFCPPGSWCCCWCL